MRYSHYAVHYVERNYLPEPTSKLSSIVVALKMRLPIRSHGFTLVQLEFVMKWPLLIVMAAGECINQAPRKVLMIWEEAKNLCQTCILD